LRLGLCDPEKIAVIGKGSDHGVDLVEYQFRPDEKDLRRDELGLTEEQFVIGFVGRISKDKGISDLVSIWSKFQQDVANSHLVVIGEIDPTDAPPQDVLAQLRSGPNISWIGGAESSCWYSAFDVLVLPTYREGFPNVILEAAACGIPSCAYRVTGTEDAVIHEVTGTLCDLYDVPAMIGALMTYFADPELRRRHGRDALRRVTDDFRAQDVWQLKAEAFAGLRRDRPR
jgi:glycosyltransferase involved in cell wall biosynthesis